MAIGTSNIPALRLTVLEKLVSKMPAAPSMFFTNKFGKDQWDSDNIEWESEEGGEGMAPFSAPDSPAEQTSIDGVANNRAHAAYWQEKMFFSESFLNNMRAPGTTATYQRAQKTLARYLQKLKYRNDRRKEWMFVKMFVDGSIDYLNKHGVAVNYSYGIPSTNSSTLATERHWDTGTSRNIVEDFMDVKLLMQNRYGINMTSAAMSTEILQMMILDPGVQTLLQKSSFGDGDLFRNPARVLGNLFGFGEFQVYDEQYKVRSFLTSAVTADSTTTISVDDATDYEVGGTLTFVDVSANTWEEETISAVSVMSSTVTVSTAPSTSYKAQEDHVFMRKKFLPTDKVIMYAETIDNQKIAEFAEAPFGNNRNWGMKMSQWDRTDPDGIYIRTQNKGLPVLYNEDAIYQLTVT